MREVIIDGVKLKRLPRSDYWISKDGTMFKIVKPLLDKQGRYHVTKNSKHFTRTKEQFILLYDKLK